MNWEKKKQIILIEIREIISKKYQILSITVVEKCVIFRLPMVEPPNEASIV